MLNFSSDYVAGAHPAVLQNLVSTNLENLPGYGSDKYCERAALKIKQACHCENAQVYFLVGGTQTNQLIISTLLKPFEGVIAAKTGHISIHEAGAIEFSGHKVIQIDGKDGKLAASDIQLFLSDFFADRNCEHMVFPKMVYLSLSTEYGTLYSKSELTEIYEVCKKFDIFLYIDGARLIYALESEGNDLTLGDIAELCDVFYIGGTKAGTLCGEAVVFTKNNCPEHFITQMKQHGALLAKGRLLGVQFDALFSDNLYSSIGKHAIQMAKKLKQLFIEKGYKFYIDSPTNQQFIIIEDAKMAELSKKVQFSFWEKYDDSHTVVRFATSWSTTAEDIQELENYL